MKEISVKPILHSDESLVEFAFTRMSGFDENEDGWNTFTNFLRIYKPKRIHEESEFKWDEAAWDEKDWI